MVLTMDCSNKLQLEKRSVNPFPRLDDAGTDDVLTEVQVGPFDHVNGRDPLGCGNLSHPCRAVLLLGRGGPLEGCGSLGTPKARFAKSPPPPCCGAVSPPLAPYPFSSSRQVGSDRDCCILDPCSIRYLSIFNLSASHISLFCRRVCSIYSSLNRAIVMVCTRVLVFDRGDVVPGDARGREGWRNNNRAGVPGYTKCTRVPGS